MAEPIRVLVTTAPFGEVDPAPAEWLRAEPRLRFDVNPSERMFTEDEAASLVAPYEVLIAGTEPLTRRVLEAAPRLKLIVRVGVGLDSVDLRAARERGIRVSYTPDAPAPAVAELTIGLMVALARGVGPMDRGMRRGEWHRHQGLRLGAIRIGVVGTGRVGGRVLRLLSAFRPATLFAHDIRPDPALYAACGAEAADLPTLLRESDLVSLHVPLTPRTRPLLGEREIALMRPGAFLVNTARGAVVDEGALARALRAGALGGAALDVFTEEPYRGELATLENVISTCHMGSCSVDCRAEMERQAAAEALRYVRGEPLRSLVPESEYEENNAECRMHNA